MFRTVHKTVNKMFIASGIKNYSQTSGFLYSDFAPLSQQDLHSFERQITSVKYSLCALSTPLIITTTLNNLKRSIVIL